MTTRAQGYAVLDAKDGLDVRTVSPTKRAAMVNWLVLHGQMIFAQTSDTEIEEMFTPPAVVEVDIVERPRS